MKHFSLFDLHQYIERVFLLNFEENIWIEAEIAEINLNNGNYYLSIIEKNDEGGLLAQASAVIWRNQVPKLKAKLGDFFLKITQTGSKLRILGEIRFHPRYGYKIQILDIDLDYSLGNYYLEKQKAIAKLEENNLFEVNKSKPLPEVIQKIAVISSPHAAGYQDFVNQLSNNQYGYKISQDLFASKMQGDEVASTLVQAISNISQIAHQYDLIVLVRGGGGSVDLGDFDLYEVAETIATAPLPVLCGIGHDKDQSIVDMVSFASVKTPTAVAEYIIQHNLNFETTCIQLWDTIKTSIRKQIIEHEYPLHQLNAQIHRHFTNIINNEKSKLTELNFQNFSTISKIFNQEQQDLNTILQKITILNPTDIMSYGYAMISQKDQWIKNLKQINPSEPITIQINSDKLTVNEKEQ